MSIKMILFCLPHGGVSAGMYNKWKKLLHPQIKLVPVELRGRGKRFSEPLYQNFTEAVADVYQQIKTKIVKEEYGVFGHCIGGLLAYELYYEIVCHNQRRPAHLFFSGQKAPNLQKLEISDQLPDREFIDQIGALGGLPTEIRQNNSLLELVAPVLKNDVKILKNYAWQGRPEQLECAVTVLHGSRDPVIRLDEMERWRDHSGQDCRVVTFEGDHFFIYDNTAMITALINRAMIQ